MALRQQRRDFDPLSRRRGEPTPYTLIVHATPQNTFMTLTHTPLAHIRGSHIGSGDHAKVYPMAGKVIAWVSATGLGFKKAKKKTYEAATQVSLAMFGKIRELMDPAVRESTEKVAVREGGPAEIQVVFKGFGPGREAVQAALMSTQADGVRQLVRSYRDATPIAVGGVRAKKRRIV